MTDCLVFGRLPPLMMLILRFFIAVLVLTQTVAFASDIKNPDAGFLTNGNRAFFPPYFSTKQPSQRIQDRIWNNLEASRQMIRFQNTQIQNLLTSLGTTNDPEKQDTIAQKLIEIMESPDYQKMKQELRELSALFTNNEANVSVQIAAVKILAEHTLPSKWIDDSLIESVSGCRQCQDACYHGKPARNSKQALPSQEKGFQHGIPLIPFMSEKQRLGFGLKYMKTVLI